MAEVWRAKARGAAGFEKIVVIKRVLPSLMAKPGFADLLVREAKIAACLSHPRIVQIFDLGEEDGSYFIAMEYVHGRSLDHAIAYRGRPGQESLSLPLRLWIIAETAAALEHAHRRKTLAGKPLHIVHRDVSPHNVLLSYDGDVKVADFGIARADSPELGKGEDPGILRGKIAYMSPEQARGEPLDARSDIFSLGVVLYELVSGARLFRGRNSEETLALVRDAQPLRVPYHLGIDSDLARILEQSLHPDREHRYRSAGALHGDLTAYLHRVGEVVGPHRLAEAMERMFPAAAALEPNKLRVDLLIRAYHDATAVSAAGAVAEQVSLDPDSTEKTAAQPRGLRANVEERRVYLVATSAREGEGSAFAAAVTRASGHSFGAQEQYRVAVFGFRPGSEQGAADAARAALEFRRLLRSEGPLRTPQVPPIGIGAATLRIENGRPRAPDVGWALPWFATVRAGEIGVAPDVVSSLGSSFRLQSTGGHAWLEGYRRPSDRYVRAVRARAVLVGRDRELRVLAEAVVHCMSGGTRRIELVGVAGVGKTRLLAELQSLAQIVSERAQTLVSGRDMAISRSAGVHFVCGRADQNQQGRSFAALIDVLGDLSGIEPDDLAEERHPKVDALRLLGLAPRELELIGELLGLAYPGSTGERPNRPRGLDAVTALRRALVALAQDRVVVVVIEDLQWLDDATRQLLPLLLAGLERPRILTVLSRRPGVTIPPVDAEPLRVAGLDPDASARLLVHLLRERRPALAAEQALSNELMQAIADHTGGEPLALEALASALDEQNAVVVEEGALCVELPLPEPAPNGYRPAAIARLASLRATDISMLNALAILEGPVPAALLYAFEGLVAADGVVVLHRLIARGLVRAWDAAGGPIEGEASLVGRWGGGQEALHQPVLVQVAHHFLRSAIRSRLGDLASRRLHQRAVEVLERVASLDADDTIDRLAHHAAAGRDAEKASEYYERAAARLLARGERRAAAERLAAAARTIRDWGEPSDEREERETRNALEAARLRLSLGEAEPAGAILDSLSLSPGSTRRFELAIVRAEAALAADCPEQAVGVLSEHEASLERASAWLRSASRLVLGRALLDVGRVDDARYAASDAAIVARADGDPLTLGRALALRAEIAAHADRLSEAEESAAEALALAARLGDIGLRFAALTAQAIVDEARSNDRAALTRFRAAFDLAEHERLGSEIRFAAMRLASAAVRVGDPEARRLAHDAWGRVRASTSERLALWGGALAHCAEGELDLVERAVDQLESTHWSAEAARVSWVLAHEALRRAEIERFGRITRRGIELARRAGWTLVARALQELDEQKMERPDAEPV